MKMRNEARVRESYEIPLNLRGQLGFSVKKMKGVLYVRVSVLGPLRPGPDYVSPGMD